MPLKPERLAVRGVGDQLAQWHESRTPQIRRFRLHAVTVRALFGRSDPRLGFHPPRRSRDRTIESLGRFSRGREAALRALEDFTKGAVHFELVGVKHVRAFDSNLMIVSVGLREGSYTTRLVGCYLADNDTCRGAATAVLHATNRVVGNYIAMR